MLDGAHSKDAAHPSGLVAVLLITRSRPGPKLVFHYPEHPYLPPKRSRRDEPESDDSDDEDDDDETDTASSTIKTYKPYDGNRYVLPDEANPDVRNGGSGESVKRLLGHSIESLEKVLSPGRWCDRQKFEIWMDGLRFIGCPVYGPEDGRWTPKGIRQSNQPTADVSGLDFDSLNMTSPKPPSGRSYDFAHVTDSFESPNSNIPFGTSAETSSSANSGPQVEAINMFHVVFVARGAGLQAQREVNAIYSDVAKPLSDALEYCQKQADYVARESRKVLAQRGKAKPSIDEDGRSLWDCLSDTSELAWALKELYLKISKGDVAGIRLNGLEMSLYLNSDGGPKSEESELTPLAALLLLDSKENMLRELSHSDASPLATFIRDLTPAKNLGKQAATLGMSVKDVLFLAAHLIRWRKARVLSQPLHARNIYVVAENAASHVLQQHVDAYHRLFPTLPTLPNMLKVLSGRPIKFGLLIPSRDHRNAYLDILSYLVRHGFVIQLRSYGWLKVPKSLLDQPLPKQTEPKRPATARSQLLSPRSKPIDDDASSVTSDRTAIAGAPSTPLSSKRLSDGTQVTNTTSSKKHKKDDYVIIKDPSNVSEEETKLVAAVKTELRDLETRDVFDFIVKYMDGKNAFEEIAAKEGFKRRVVEDLIGDLEEKGWIVWVRYT